MAQANDLLVAGRFIERLENYSTKLAKEMVSFVMERELIYTNTLILRKRSIAHSIHECYYKKSGDLVAVIVLLDRN